MRKILSAVIGTAMVAASPALLAQETAYPARPIKLVVAFGPGSVNDAMARELAKTLYNELGQPVIVENKPGAGGVVGTDYVAKSAPDGYTLGFGTSSQLVMNVGLQKSLPFDVERDLTPIGLVSRTPLALAVPASGANSLAELVKQAKSKSQPMTYSSSGVGSINHIAGAAFARAAGVELMHVPYKGAATAAADLAVRTVKPTDLDLISRRLARVPLGVYASRAYLRRRGVPGDDGDLQGHDVVLYDRPFRGDGRTLCGVSTAYARVAMEVNSGLMLLQAVRAGMGLGELQVRMAETHPELVRIWPERTERVDVWLVLHADLARTARVRAVVDAIVEAFDTQ